MAKSPNERNPMTPTQKRQAKMRELAKAGEYYASMGGRGPKKGTAANTARRKKFDAEIRGLAKAYGQAASSSKAASKAERSKPPRAARSTKPTPKTTGRGGRSRNY